MPSRPRARILAWPSRAPAPAPAGGVLLAEAHADTRELYAMWLRQRGVQVSVAASADDALAAARAAAPDAIVVELMLPGGGLPLIRELRADPATAGALIIVLTTQTQPSLRAAALAAGADLYVAKPCGAPRLAQLIALGGRRRDLLARLNDPAHA